MEDHTLNIDQRGSDEVPFGFIYPPDETWRCGFTLADDGSGYLETWVGNWGPMNSRDMKAAQQELGEYYKRNVRMRKQHD